MKAVVWLLIIGTALWVGRQIHDAWLRVKASDKKQDTTEVQKAVPASPGSRGAVVAPPAPLTGLPEALEAGLQDAQKQGAVPLKQWLDQHRRQIADPRLASIELDYVLLVGTQNRGEARRVLVELSLRLSPDSPVYSRFKKLKETYE